MMAADHPADIDCRKVLRGNGTSLYQPFADGAIVVAPDNVVERVAIHVARCRNMPAGADCPEVRSVHASARANQPFADHTTVAAPQQVGSTIRVEIRRSHNMPVTGRGPEIDWCERCAVHQPGSSGAAIAAPKDVIAAVGINIADTDDVPVEP